MRSLWIYGQLAPLTSSRVARRLRRRMLLVDPLVVNVLAELHSSSSQKHMWPWRWPWEILFQIMHSRQINNWQTNASKYWSWYFQLWKFQQLISMKPYHSIENHKSTIKYIEHKMKIKIYGCPSLINIYLCHTCMVHHKEVNLKRISTCALDLKYILLQVLLIHSL